MPKLWSYHCPECKEGFGDLEGEVIKKMYDGFGDQHKLIKCPRCGKWIILGPYMSCDEFNLEDLEFWGLTDEQMEQARQAGYLEEVGE